ncbi:uncharacterized protein LOC116262473 isoform X2 [Nymphaea colorata]|uniref:uncharacterized protein LOC116262473 isoform X2 n=1 Tax=Nymphaea colorata TaxID=210225 RepID=UPI00214F4CCD|nr:uncharacterized protein LOC116262473 isoform X2 [Nymphaea colorata]
MAPSISRRRTVRSRCVRRRASWRPASSLSANQFTTTSQPTLGELTPLTDMSVVAVWFSLERETLLRIYLTILECNISLSRSREGKNKRKEEESDERTTIRGRKMKPSEDICLAHIWSKLIEMGASSPDCFWVSMLFSMKKSMYGMFCSRFGILFNPIGFFLQLLDRKPFDISLILACECIEE